MILAIIRRIDLDCDAKLNELEFIDALRPLENPMNLPYDQNNRRGRSSQGIRAVS